MKRCIYFVILLLCCLICFRCGGLFEDADGYPTVTITQPGKTLYLTDEEIKFEGSGYDKEFDPTTGEEKEMPLTGSQLAWTSSIDGQIGTGERFAVTNLSAGKHTITLTGTGYNGANADASILLIIE